jgi:glycine betaine/choline ABC-type transport system substrate-binding protein
VVRWVVMERYSALAAALEHLGGTLSAATMRRLNYAADGEHRDPGEVARTLRGVHS